MELSRRRVRRVASASCLVFLLGTAACSDSSDDDTESEVARCDSSNATVVCIADVESIGSAAVSELDAADGGDPGAMSSGSCAQSSSAGGPWSICVVPIDDGQVVIGRDSGDGLSARARVGGADLEFPLDNGSGEATIVHGRSTIFEVVDRSGAVVGELGGMALTGSGS